MHGCPVSKEFVLKTWSGLAQVVKCGQTGEAWNIRRGKWFMKKTPEALPIDCETTDFFENGGDIGKVRP
jgi:hypothetical protein